MAELSDRLHAALGENYRILRELGGGGMSRVFLAEEARLGRRVVIKVLTWIAVLRSTADWLRLVCSLAAPACAAASRPGVGLA